MYKYLLLFTFSFIAKISIGQSLGYYLDSAYANSPLIKDNINQIKASDYEKERLKAYYQAAQWSVSGNYLLAPVVSTDGGSPKLELATQSAQKYYGYELGATNGGQFMALLNYNKPLLNAGWTKTASNQVDIGRQVNQNNIQLTKHDLQRMVTDQYILCLLDEKQMIFTDSILQIVNRQLQIVKKLAVSSLMKQSDISLLNVESQNDQNIYLTYKASYMTKLLDLNILCGIKDTSYVELPDIDVVLSNNYILSNASQFNEKFRLDSLNLEAAQKVFELKYKPQLSFFANSGLNTVTLSKNYNRLGLSAGLIFSWNFADGHQKTYMRNKLKISQETIQNYKTNFLLQNDVHRTQYIQQIQLNKERQSLLRDQLNQYQSILSDYKKEIIQGNMPIVNYITVLKSMVTANSNLYVLESNNQLLENAYNYYNW